MTRNETLEEINTLERYLEENANFTRSEAYQSGKERLSRLRKSIGLVGCYAQHMPGQSRTIWCDSLREAQALAAEANRQPWNRNSNAAQIVHP